MSVVKISGQLRLVASVLLHRQRKLTSPIPFARNAGSTLYRSSVFKEPPNLHYAGEFLSFVLWYWMLYHCWFEFDHLIPQQEYPDPKAFTNEELGIPADDED